MRKKIVAGLLIGLIVTTPLMNVKVPKEKSTDSNVEPKISWTLGSDSSEIGSDVELDEDEFQNLDYETIIDATTMENGDDSEEALIQNLDEIYGEKITKIDPADIAKIELASSYGMDIKDFNNIKNIKLGKKIVLYDANDYNTYVAYNFSVENKEKGYITISTHTKAPLIKEIKKNVTLPEVLEKAYYFSEGELYFDQNGSYRTLDNEEISKEEFDTFKKERRENYYNFTISMLAEIEVSTVAEVNNLVYLSGTKIEELSVGKHYSGQDKDAYGYGGISNVSQYISNRYGGKSNWYSSGKSLSMNSAICSDWRNDRNCTLVAITRILYYYRGKGYKKIDSSIDKIYNKVLAVAKKYGYTEKRGTFPTKINNIIEKVLDDYGYGKSYSKGIYVWSFNNQVKKEINSNRPVVMNIARGYYGNHSLTVCGYQIHKSKHKLLWGSYNKTHNFIQVYDGWSRGKRYIDYEAFAYDLVTSGFGSFNTVIMK